MVTKLHRQCRADDALRMFAKDRMTFMTLTTADVVDYETIRQRWRNLRHYIVEKYREKKLKYIMNFELHPRGHGWHIHCVFNDYIQLRGGGLASIRAFGFGMVNVKKVNSLGVAQYLSKHCLKAYRGVQKHQKGMGKRLRLVNCSRGLPRLSDYRWASDYNERVRRYLRLSTFKCSFKGVPFFQLYTYASLGVLSGWRVHQLVDFIRNGKCVGVSPL